VVALPTETVYGLAGRYDSEEAIDKIFKTKGRPSFDPLIVHVSNAEQAKELTVSWPYLAQILADKFWPGPLTIVLPKAANVDDKITAGLRTVALRSPDHQGFRSILADLGVPLAAPSANRFGKTSPTTAEHVEAEFDGLVPVMDGGPCRVGVESTVVAIEDGRLQILRPGAITQEMLQEATGALVTHRAREDSPGHLKDHYQPEAPLYLEAKEGLPELQLNQDPSIAARELYGLMREYSQRSPSGFYILKSNYPTTGFWQAIWDRLERAASKIE
jgi:L-threonylcarbamoyladenylate synthase